jgi:hypothetical protein
VKEIWGKGNNGGRADYGRNIVMIVDEVLKDLDGIERGFRKRVLEVLSAAAGDKKVVVEWEELIWETRKLRRRAMKTLGQK